MFNTIILSIYCTGFAAILIAPKLLTQQVNKQGKLKSDSGAALLNSLTMLGSNMPSS